MLIDSHCHLLHERYADEPAFSPADLIDQARTAGVGQLIAIACERHEWAPTLQLAAASEGRVVVGAGIHPHQAGEGGLVTEAELLGLAAEPEVVALGETGLDYFYDNADRTVQAESFRLHLQACAKTGLPAIVHTRLADDDTLAILRDFAGIGFVLHCFTGTRKLAEAALELGGYISFSGIVTFKKSHELRELARSLPKERILVETDAPYLAPEPVRGPRSTPAMVTHTATRMADLWQTSPTEAAEILTANTRRLFNRLPRL